MPNRRGNTPFNHRSGGQSTFTWARPQQHQRFIQIASKLDVLKYHQAKGASPVAPTTRGPPPCRSSRMVAELVDLERYLDRLQHFRQRHPKRR